MSKATEIRKMQQGDHRVEIRVCTYAGDVLNRYLGFVKRAGRDY